MQPNFITLYTPAHRSAFDVGARLLRHLSDWVRRQHAEHLERVAVRRDAHTLAALDDATLRDLGLHRSELAALACQPREPDRARVMRSVFGPRS